MSTILQVVDVIEMKLYNVKLCPDMVPLAKLAHGRNIQEFGGKEDIDLLFRLLGGEYGSLPKSISPLLGEVVETAAGADAVYVFWYD